jgi:hypothetical protein
MSGPNSQDLAGPLTQREEVYTTNAVVERRKESI